MGIMKISASFPHGMDAPGSNNNRATIPDDLNIDSLIESFPIKRVPHVKYL